MHEVLRIAREHSRVLILLFSILCILGVVVALLVAPMSPFSGLHNDLKTIEPDPSLAYTDLDGNAIDLNAFKGKPLLINSFASWMPFSKDELVLMNTLKKEYGDSLTVLAINRMEDREVIKAYLATFGIGREVTFVIDPGDTFYKAVEGYAMPETILYDEDGVISFRVRGVVREEEIRSALQPLFE